MKQDINNVLSSEKCLDTAHDNLGLSALEAILLQLGDNLVGVKVVVGDNAASEEQR